MTVKVYLDVYAASVAGSRVNGAPHEYIADLADKDARLAVERYMAFDQEQMLQANQHYTVLRDLMAEAATLSKPPTDFFGFGGTPAGHSPPTAGYRDSAKPVSLVGPRFYAAARAIVDNLSDRRGLKREWATVDDDVKAEIIETWARIIERAVNERER